jgi:hypothetical protein
MKISGDEYLGYIEEQWPNILKLYKKFEDKKPVMFFDIQERKIYAYPYNDFKSNLSKRSKTMLEKQYSDALLDNKIVVFVKDSEKRKLISVSYALE